MTLQAETSGIAMATTIFVATEWATIAVGAAVNNLAVETATAERDTHNFSLKPKECQIWFSHCNCNSHTAPILDPLEVPKG